jgi:hypothetical protein
MAGKPATSPGERGGAASAAIRVFGALRGAVAIGGWLLSACAVQAGMGDDVGRMVRPLEERLELRVRDRSAPQPERRQHERTYDDSIEPWELVSV